MKVLSIGMDKKLFVDGSDVLSRSIGYAEKMEELHIVVFALEKAGYVEKKIGNLFIYPTNSKSRFKYISDAKKIGQKIIQKNSGDWIITTQDPFETGLVGYKLKKKLNLPLQIQI